MDRRLLSFIIASTAFFFFYVSMLRLFGPPPAPNVAQEVADVDLIDAADNPVIGAPDDDNPSGADSSGDNLGEAAVAESTAEDADQDKTADQARDAESKSDRPTRAQWSTLGSMDSDSGHWMLVTLNSRGGGIERIELTVRDEDQNFKYRRVDVRTGYLGYLAAEPAAKTTGVLVNVVGPGTPAALATSTTDGSQGLKVGDIIVSINAVPITSPADIDTVLSTTKPEEHITIDVIRGAESKSEGGSALVFDATLTEHPLDLVRLASTGGDDQINANNDRLSCLITLSQVNRASIATNQAELAGAEDARSLVWNSDSDATGSDDTAVFDIELTEKEMEPVGGKPVRITRTYSLNPGSYILDMSVQIENLADEAQKLGYRLEGANGITLEGWWYSNKINPTFSRAAARDIVCKTTAMGHQHITGCNLVKRIRKTPKDPNESLFAAGTSPDDSELNYVGVDAQYFDVAYIPPVGQTAMNYFRRGTAHIIANESLIQKYQEHAVNSSFFLDSVAREVPAGKALRHEFRLFAGPKVTEVVEQYGLSDCIYYGWFAKVAKLLGSLLHGFHWLFGNYAIAVIALTVFVRGLMFPLSRKAAVNAQRMQELAPELKKIAEQYKDDMEGRLKAQRELQARVGFNPLAGCAPMFLQLPIFIGLYRALSVDIELRQAAASPKWDWASNLSGPDMFSYWADWMPEFFSGRGTGWLGPYFNILPVLVVVLFLTQQKMFMPPATDDQTAMTQKVMGFMTFFMGLFFFRVPAGLCLYFIASSVWGICERMLVKKTLPKGKHFDQSMIDGDVVDAVAAKPKATLADKIRNQIKPPEEAAPRPNKRKRPPGGNKNRH